MKNIGMIILTVFTLNASAQENIKIAVVDMQNALQNVNQGKKAKAQLEKELNTKKKTLQDEQTAIQKLSEEFKKKAMAMSEDAKMKKQQEFQERIMKFQEATSRSQNEMQQKELELTAPIIKSLKELTKEIAAKKSYQFVFEKNENLVLVAPEKDDLTKELVDLYNSKNK